MAQPSDDTGHWPRMLTLARLPTYGLGSMLCMLAGCQGSTWLWIATILAAAGIACLEVGAWLSPDRRPSRTHAISLACLGAWWVLPVGSVLLGMVMERKPEPGASLIEHWYPPSTSDLITIAIAYGITVLLALPVARRTPQRWLPGLLPPFALLTLGLLAIAVAKNFR